MELQLTKAQRAHLSAFINEEQRNKVRSYTMFTWNMNCFSRHDIELIALELLRASIED